jgi:hypothetical protein
VSINQIRKDLRRNSNKEAVTGKMDRVLAKIATNTGCNF